MRPLKLFMTVVLCLHLAFCATIQNKKSQDNEKDPEYQFKKAKVAMKYGLTEEAIKYLHQALTLDPAYYQAQYLLGVAFYNIKSLNEAASAFQKSLELRPDSSEAHIGLASVYEEMSLLDKAEHALKQAYAIDSSYNACFSLARIYFHQEKPDLALQFIQEAAQKNNLSAEVHNFEGVILNQRGDYAKAVASFQNALRINPDFIAARINLGVAYINNQDFDTALTLLTETLPLVQDQALKDRINQYLEMLKKKTKPHSP